MKQMGDRPRKKALLYFDENLKEFLEELRGELNLSISQIIEQATLTQYKQDYEEFISRKKNIEKE